VRHGRGGRSSPDRSAGASPRGGPATFDGDSPATPASVRRAPAPVR
jgi:hypothetical protein